MTFMKRCVHAGRAERDQSRLKSGWIKGWSLKFHFQSYPIGEDFQLRTLTITTCCLAQAVANAPFKPVRPIDMIAAIPLQLFKSLQGWVDR